jgi:hypothetical protein
VESLGFLGEGGKSDSGDEGLPDNPAEWLASIGGTFNAQPDAEEVEEE